MEESDIRKIFLNYEENRGMIQFCQESNIISNAVWNLVQWTFCWDYYRH